MKLTELMPSIFKMIPYEYEVMKTDEYDLIIHSFLFSVARSAQPKLRQISGIPGSGKSALCKAKLDDDWLFLSFDLIMDRIPAYHNDVESLGLIGAFEKWEIPARIMGYELLRQAIESQIDIIFEHSGVNEAHVELFKNIKHYGYLTEVDFTLCDKEIAFERVRQREQIVKRHTPRQIVEERAALMEKYIPIYQQVADKVVVYDTSGDEPKLSN